MRAVPVLVAIALLSAAPSFGAPAKSSASRPAAPAAAEKETPKLFADQFEGLTFRCIGPYRGGRVCAVTGVRHQPLVFYMGATGGGVWRTTDGGSNWEVLSDKDFGRGSLGVGPERDLGRHRRGADPRQRVRG